MIVIDPGHGGTDNGAVYGFTEEDDINLGISFYLDYELRLNSNNRMIKLKLIHKDG